MGQGRAVPVGAALLDPDDVQVLRVVGLGGQQELVQVGGQLLQRTVCSKGLLQGRRPCPPAAWGPALSLGRVQGSLRSGQASLCPAGHRHACIHAPPWLRGLCPQTHTGWGGGAARAGRCGPEVSASAPCGWMYVVSKPSGLWTSAPSHGQTWWHPRDGSAASLGACLALQPEGESLCLLTGAVSAGPLVTQSDLVLVPALPCFLPAPVPQCQPGAPLCGGKGLL